MGVSRWLYSIKKTTRKTFRCERETYKETNSVARHVGIILGLIFELLRDCTQCIT